MDEAFGQFLAQVAAHWWLWAVVAALLCDQALRLAVPAYRQRTDRWLKPGWRGALSVVAAAVVALVGGYLAYRDVSLRLADTEKRLAETVVLQPKLNMLETTTERLPDGTYRISKLVEIVSRTPPGRLHIAATARG